ncbi:ribosome maturation factor RimP [Alkalibacter mobilis]|uniref:ribosome maturation factor RimP n=1 Tax=Alkalibacter mobilis TaxID=2787712 RepID=UPI00189D4B07|nr:ribosome maturation factor RimP [Alkalibacter mobilis]MBF7095801.1 ribosome maturation factor RimP [Alkalibacter mobilis]
MAKIKTEDLVKEAADPIAESMGFELVDVEYLKEGQNWFLRIYIDKDGGVTLEDCQTFSGKINEWLDRTDPIQSSYFLEVSSPGLDRPLKKPSDFERYLDKEIEVTLYTQLDGSKYYKGVNKGIVGENLLLIIDKDKSIEIPYKNVGSAKLYFEF